MRSTTPLARLLAAGAFAAAMVPQTPVYAAPNVDQWQHILDCAGWMFSDPDRHRAECSPGHDFFLPGNNFSQTGITGEPPPPPPPLPEENCYSIPGAYAGQGRLIPVVGCCNTVSLRGSELGASRGALIQVQAIDCCPPINNSYRIGEFGAAIIQVDVVCETDASPSDQWIVRPTLGLLV